MASCNALHSRSSPAAESSAASHLVVRAGAARSDTMRTAATLQTAKAPAVVAKGDFAHVPVKRSAAGSSWRGRANDIVLAAPLAVHRSPLRISSPGDPAEREAEAVAARVVNMRSPDEAQPSAVHAMAGAQVAPAAAAVPHPPTPHEARARPDEVLQPDLVTELRAALSEGEKLPPSVLAFMAPRFRADFSTVRIDTSPRAARLAARLNARAFTFGRKIFFGKDQFRPDTMAGRELIAHELTHTIQQREIIQRQVDTAVVGTAAAMPAVAFRSPPVVQRWSLGEVLDGLAEKANLLPGFRMMTLVLGVNPIDMAPVSRDAADILRAVIELVPSGGLLTQALDQYGVIGKAGAWLQERLAGLGLTGASIKASVSRFIDGLGLSDGLDLGDVWERAKRIFTGPVDSIKALATGAMDALVGFVRDAILKPLAEKGAESRGWALLTAVIGRNPITGEAVPRNPETLIGGFMTLIGQEEVWANVRQGNAVARCWAWFEKSLGELTGFVSAIPDLFLGALRSLGLADLLSPVTAFARIAGVFGSFAGRFVVWGGQAVWNLLEIVFDVVKPGALGYVRRAGAALRSILKNPVPFVGQLVRAAKLGFTNFASNVGTHLKTGLIDWLTGALPDVYIPTALSLGEIGKFALSVLRVSWTYIRAKIVKALGPDGERTMSVLEKTFDVVTVLVKGGAAAVWDLVKDRLATLRDTVIDGIIGFVTETIVKKAIPKLISMFVPGAGFVSAIISIYDTVMVFVEKLSRIAAAVSGFLGSLAAIAEGRVEAAAAKVERTLAGLVSLAIGFLAGFLGLGNVAEKVKAVIQKVAGVVDRALDKAVAWVIGGAMRLGITILGVGRNIAGALGLGRDAPAPKTGAAGTRPAHGGTPLPSVAEPVAVRVTGPFSMNGTGHTLTIAAGPRGVDVIMASEPGALVPKLRALQREIKASPVFSASKKAKLNDRIEAIIYATDRNIVRAAYASFLQVEGTILPYSKAFLTFYMGELNRRIKEIGDQFEFRDLYARSFLPDPLPAQRFIPQKVINVRSVLYDGVGDWTSKRAAAYEAGKVAIGEAIAENILKPLESKERALALKRLAAMQDGQTPIQGLKIKSVPYGVGLPAFEDLAGVDAANRGRNFVEGKRDQYSVDHHPSLAEHWVKGGNRMPDKDRRDAVEGNGGTRLALMTARGNSEKGSDGYKFEAQRWVGPPFTSIHAADLTGKTGTEDAVTIKGHSLLNDKGVPLLPFL